MDSFEIDYYFHEIDFHCGKIHINMIEKQTPTSNIPN